MARARVTNVQAVSQFIMYSDNMDVNGDSWTIQCEVVQHHQLGEEPPEEDPMPNELEMRDEVPFDFFGLGQPVVNQEQNDQQEQENGIHQQNQGQGQQEQQGLFGLNQLLQQNNPWEPWQAWPAELPAQQPAQQQVQDLNATPEEMQIDLNMLANVDPLEVIINPVNLPVMNGSK